MKIDVYYVRVNHLIEEVSSKEEVLLLVCKRKQDLELLNLEVENLVNRVL